MNNWQPIATAPKDETVILTEDGIAYYDTRRAVWYACDFSGNYYTCADDGHYTCSPKYWMPLPEYPKAN